jgi:hypothetical protein
MQKILPLLGVLLFVSISAAQAQTQEPDASLRDLPRTHWAYTLLEQWDKSGELPSPFPADYMLGERNYNRYGFAVMAARALERMPRPGEGRDYRVSPLVMGILRRFTREFEPEMKRLGVVMPEVYVRLGQPEPFPNVPENHWAAPSIERLRKMGILVGDPSGKF